MKATDLTAKITEHIQHLAQATDQAAVSEAMRLYLQACSRFHHYSPFNQLLIQLTNPSATHVAGYTTWQKLNRFVRRGEHGIPILAPCIYKVDPDKDDSPKRLQGFRVVYVFDVAQTEGEPLPPPPDWKSPARRLELENRLIHFAESKGISVDRKELAGETQGVSRGGQIDLADQAGTKTLMHEIAHELLHQTGKDRTDRQTREIEAEAVAWVVCQHFEIEDLNSPNYLALWAADSDRILARLDRIPLTAHHLITAVETDAQPAPTPEPEAAHL